MNQLLEDMKNKIVVPTGQTVGFARDNFDEDFSSSDDEDEQDGPYEQDYVNQEMEKYASGSVVKKNNDYTGMSEVEGVDGYDYKNNPLNVYSSYNFNTTFVKKELPIDSFRSKILSLIEVNNVVVIQGPTGCGKTTQVPQFILDDCRIKQDYCNVAITQPRKIATINIAKRVCEERGWTMGTVCGYQIGLEKKVSNDVLLTYMTTGVLLQKLIAAKSLQQFTHIIIDEVHERNQELDFLLLVVRKFLFTNSPRTKVILMSATIDAEEFAYYFRSQNFNISIPAPIIQVDKQSIYKKHFFHLEHLGTASSLSKADLQTFEIDRPEISECVWNIFTFLVKIINKLDNVDPITNKKIIGSVLVFLPGINEIEEAHQRLLKFYGECEGEDKLIKWEIIPLHSSLPNDEQARVFKSTNPGYRKIILSTNIAESSITVPATYYVIDFCLTKVMTVDPMTKYMSLKLEWASHVNCEQRAGRVGRIGSGRVYRLVPYDFYNRKMSRKSIPEILRAPLERIVLQAKMLELNDTPRQILALAINPPDLKNIEMTILGLKEIGALLQTCQGVATGSDGDLTFLGTVMANLPVDVRLSKLIVLGHMFSCLNEAVIIAAGCSIQNIFAIPFKQRLNAYKKLLLWSDGSFSDLIGLLNVYQVWQSYRRDNQFENFTTENRWCTINLVSLKGLKEWHLLTTEIQHRLERLNISTIPGQFQLKPDERVLILKIITTGAFYPNYFLRAPDSAQLMERDAVKMVGGRNPFRTVYFTGMDPSQPGPLYTKAIKNLLKDGKDCEIDVAIGFDGSSKIYVEFQNVERRREQVTVSMNGRQVVTDAIPGRIPIEVYEVLRKKQLRYIFQLNIWPLNVAWSCAEKNGIKRNNSLQQLQTTSSKNNDTNCFSEMSFSPIPSYDIEYIRIKVTEYIDAAHFWANILESEIYLARIEEILNKTVLHGVLESGKSVDSSQVYAARYFEDNKFYRCKVNTSTPQNAQVTFIDYGNIQEVPTKELYLLPDIKECKMPALGIECILHGIQPSRKLNPKGVWTERINEHWKRQTFGILLFGKVHSVVEDVVSLELFKNEPGHKQTKSINKLMLEQGHAEEAVEGYMSKADHEKRVQVLNSENPNVEAARLGSDKVVNYKDFDTPTVNTSYKTIELKGPFSPLAMKLYGCVESSSTKSVDIEGSSVNTVLLDSEPQDYHNRLLVAGSVAQTMSGDRVKLRQTTLMPNIPGLPTVLTLLFCPTMEPKVTEDGTRVASILCGLGYNQYTGKSYYPQHDLVIVLDTVLTENEINKINKIRFYMNQGLKLMEDIAQGLSSQEEMVMTQNYIKKDLISLIYDERQSMDRTNVKYCHAWGKNNGSFTILQANAKEDASEDVWPLLSFVRLQAQSKYDVNVAKNLDDLDQIARGMKSEIDIQCLLCHQSLFGVYAVRCHLCSKKHKAQVAEYQSQIEVESVANN